MEYKIDENVLKRAISIYGKKSQTFMLFEEMAELQKEVCKIQRGKQILFDCEEEIADVYIMIEQLKIMYGLNDENIQGFINRKVRRLDERIDNEYMGEFVNGF